MSISERVKKTFLAGKTVKVEKSEIETLRNDVVQAKREASKLRNAVSEARREVQQIGDVAAFMSSQNVGIPIPPENLRMNVGARPSVANFMAQGVGSAERVLEIFGDAPAGPILDWGCGSGRTLRWLYHYPQWRNNYYGCDVDKDAIAWLSQYRVNNVFVCDDAPPLPYSEQKFGGLFAFSVLTHIHPSKHRAWYEELRRVLQVGGIAFLTTQGASIIQDPSFQISQEAKDSFDREGHGYVQNVGHYKDAAFVSESYTRRALDGLFDIEYYRIAGYAKMDAFLVRRID